MKTVLTFTSLFLAFSSFAQDKSDIPAEARAAAQSVKPEAIKAHMRFLADDAMEGRKPGTRGYRLAANYVISQFEALGLQPAGDGQTYLQKVPLRQWRVQEEGSSLAFIGKNGKEQLLTLGKNYTLSPVYGDETSEITAPVVFVGFGVTAPDLNYDDYKNVDVKGKIVAYFNGAPAAFPSNQRAYHGSAKLENAAAHGAVGVISFSLPTDVRNRLEASSARARQGTYRWIGKDGKPQRVFPELKGIASLGDSTARTVFAQSGRSLADIIAAANKSIPQSFPLNFSVRIKTETRSGGDIAGYNVVGVLPGTDPVLKNEYVVYASHLDHLGIGRPVKGDSIFNGAHDNASGVAINLEAARMYAALPTKPKRSILFVGVTAEEMGLLGSDYFASNPTVPKENIVANLCLDMPFFFHPLVDIVPYGSEHSSMAKEVNTVANYLGVKVAKDPIPEQVVFMRSDHFSFVRQGIPAIYIKSGTEAGNPQLDGLKLNLDWRATIYHSPQDEIDQPFDFNAAAKHAQLQFLIGYLTAQNPKRPTWNPGDFFGTKFGTKQTVKSQNNSGK
ncbi:Zn-dependent M28 family amino/carboxypeptidase [Larkinella arboricola]|uniref:Zn-dependent M28 family amino/carboxypeptidase n=1 Tax=Larkinella arboricola TaxID=643671 RepID=A0A327WZI6_LARAB|nr:M28 family metallopeptidase [Larkinella arboricola]RAJ97980.1 Zn-dependent M28 family amino/carboxypeptidase [Larkinella arboricola]